MTRAATIFLAAATSLVIVAVVCGFMLIPSPAQQRILNLDAKRVSALTSLRWAISSYTSSHGSLPDSLEELARTNETARRLMKDVETGQTYEYIKGEGLRYQLCATFAQPTQPGTSSDFRHPAGRHCLDGKASASP